MTSFKVTVDASAVIRLADSLEALSPENFNQVAVSAVNRTADAVYDLAVPRMISVINLTDSYVRDRMKVNRAVTRAEAQIVAARDSAHQTMLSRYGDDQQTKPVNWSNSRIAGMGLEFGKWPGWTMRIGDRSRGIPADSKAAGVTVQVARGSTKLMPGAFLLKLKGGDVGIATHSGSKYKVRYGPAVYQLFRTTAIKMVDESSDMLEETLVGEVNKFIERSL